MKEKKVEKEGKFVVNCENLTARMPSCFVDLKQRKFRDSKSSKIINKFSRKKKLKKSLTILKQIKKSSSREDNLKINEKCYYM